MFSVLEKESGVVSAYDEMGSDSEQDDEGGWGAALRQFRRKLSDETYYTDSQHDPEWTYTQHLPVTSPSSGQYTNTETVNSDSEASSVPPACPRRSPHNPMRKKGIPDTHLHPHHQPLYHQHLHQNLHPYPQPCDALDVNFNPKVRAVSRAAMSAPGADHVRCLRTSAVMILTVLAPGDGGQQRGRGETERSGQKSATPQEKQARINGAEQQAGRPEPHAVRLRHGTGSISTGAKMEASSPHMYNTI